MNKGVISVLVAYLIWGLYPFYFHAMQHVAPAEIVQVRRTILIKNLNNICENF